MSIKNPLPRGIPEKQGVSSSHLLKFLDSIEEKKLELHSFMLLRHGHVIAEGWWHPYSSDKTHMLFSLSKSFTSTAIGFAAGEGLLSVEDRVITFFPEDAPEKASEFLSSMRVKHLLSMSAGHAKDPSEQVLRCEDGNWVRAFLRIPVDYEPGTHFVYNTAATYMLSAILQKITGQALLDYLQPRLFEPLGIENAAWEVCPRGINTGGFGLSIKTEDIAKFGQLYLQKGVWNGKQILDSAWIEEATASQISNGNDPLSDWAQGYGYQFWRCRHNAYRADGAFGQYCIVLPDKDAVIAITSGLRDLQAVLNTVWEQLLPGIHPAPLQEDEAVAALRERMQNLALPLQPGQPNKSASDKISGKVFKLQKNPSNIESVCLKFEEDFCSLTFTNGEGTQLIPCGFNAYSPGTLRLPPTFAPLMPYGSCEIMACGNWCSADTFAMLLRLVKTPFYFKITCSFHGDDLEIRSSINVNFGPAEFPVLKGRLSSN